MVNASVQKRPVMGYQNEALFATEILTHQFTAPDIQVVGGLVDQQEVVLLGKQHR